MWFVAYNPEFIQLRAGVNWTKAHWHIVLGSPAYDEPGGLTLCGIQFGSKRAFEPPSSGVIKQGSICYLCLDAWGLHLFKNGIID